MSDVDAMHMFQPLPPSADRPTEFSMSCVCYHDIWTTLDTDVLGKFRLYLPGRGRTFASAMDQVVSTNTVVMTFVEDAVSGCTPVEPVCLYAYDSTGGSIRTGGTICIGEVPEMFLCARGLVRGTMAPAVSPYAFTCMEGYYWIPGSEVPSY
jgi:hypothetical protein